MITTAFEGTLIFAAADSPTAAGDAVPLRLHGESAPFSVVGKRLEITSAVMEAGTAGEYHLYLSTANTDEAGAASGLVRILSSMKGSNDSLGTATDFRALALDLGDNLWLKVPSSGSPTVFLKVNGFYHTD